MSCGITNQTHWFKELIKKWNKWNKINSLRPSDAISYTLVSIGLRNDLLPDGTKPLPEPMLIYYQWAAMIFNWGQFNNRNLPGVNELKYIMEMFHGFHFRLIDVDSTAPITTFHHRVQFWSGDQFTKVFLFVIQIQWKIYTVVLSNL